MTVKPYTVGRQWPGVAYDVFNNMSTYGLVTCSTALGQQHGTVLLQLCIIAVPDEWSIALALYYGCTIAARLTELPAQNY
jgi:hypothetical protein